MTGSLPAFLLALAVAIAILLKRSYRYFGRSGKNHPPLVTLPRPAALGHSPGQAPAEWAKYEVELHETARRLSAQLDSKMIALTELTRQAQQTIEKLETLLADLQGVPSEEAATIETAIDPAANARGRLDLAPQQAEIYALADHGYSEVTIAHRAGVSLGTVQQILAERAGQ